MIHALARISVKPDSATDAPHEFQAVEQWADRASVDEHIKAPHITAALEAAGPMFSAPPAIHGYEKRA